MCSDERVFFAVMNIGSAGWKKQRNTHIWCWGHQIFWGGKRRNRGRNKGFCCGDLGKLPKIRWFGGQWPKKGHQNFLEM